MLLEQRILDLQKDKGALIDKVRELEKENAELKRQVENPQLTKAKEIIKEILSILPKENIEGVYEITEEAEQFIKE